MSYDSAKEQIIILEQIVHNKDSVLVSYVRIIDNKDSQINNLQTSMLLCQEKFDEQERISQELEGALLTEQRKNKILTIGGFSGTGLAFVIGFILGRQ